MKEIPSYLVNFRLADLVQEETEVLILGSGIAGLYLALKLAPKYRVTVVTKDEPQEGATALAQGGIAAAVGAGDSPELHLQDTLAAGAGLSDPVAARMLVEEAGERVRELLDWGVPFDREGEDLALGREGAHSRRRVLHAGGDATGAVVWQSLTSRVREQNRIRLVTQTPVLDLLREEGRCYGALFLTPPGRPVAVLAGATVLATGGAGRLYPLTTNPPVATGDGVAMAYRAGAEVADLEFFQFHPTVLVHPGAKGFLVSEAVRGEGAVLRNPAGERFMPRYHPLAELAPRDVVSRAVVREMDAFGSEWVYLDLSDLATEVIEHRFPNLVSVCRRLGLDLRRDWLPVAPAAHYLMGGVRTDLWGRTNLEGLYACGEVACTGVHGANRLASNSLLEALVFGGRLAEELLARPRLAAASPKLSYRELDLEGGAGAEEGPEVREIVGRQLGPVRSGEGLDEARRALERLWPRLFRPVRGRAEMEARNCLLLAGLMAYAASWRRESRGAHYRTDFPEPDPAYCKRLVLSCEQGVPRAREA
ncbi:MAG: L-aspartate oxidase [Moorellales bacterium]